MKLIIYFDSDCLACFDNVLMAMLELKNNNEIKEFLYKPFDMAILDSETKKEELVEKIISDSHIDHKFSKFEEIDDPKYEEYKKDFLPYTKSLFDE